MFGIGLPEMILILALALIVVGPDKLPELARSIAKGVLELKKTVSTLKEDLAGENPFDSVKPELEEMTDAVKKQLGDTGSGIWSNSNDDEKAALTAEDEHDEVPASEGDKNDSVLIDVDSADYVVSNQTASDKPEQVEERGVEGDTVSDEQSEEPPDPAKPAGTGS